MSEIKQPFQMLPFSPNIEFQFRLRSDCDNDICDVPIIPSDKFVPFFIVTDTDPTIGEVRILCHDEPFEYTRTQNFTRDNCGAQSGSTVSFSKTYYSTISPLDAQKKAFEDTQYYVEGQAYANINGICETYFFFNSAGDYFLNSTDGKYKHSH